MKEQVTKIVEPEISEEEAAIRAQTEGILKFQRSLVENGFELFDIKIVEPSRYGLILRFSHKTEDFNAELVVDFLHAAVFDQDPKGESCLDVIGVLPEDVKRVDITSIIFKDEEEGNIGDFKKSLFIDFSGSLDTDGKVLVFSSGLERSLFSSEEDVRTSIANKLNESWQKHRENNPVSRAVNDLIVHEI